MLHPSDFEFVSPGLSHLVNGDPRRRGGYQNPIRDTSGIRCPGSGAGLNSTARQMILLSYTLERSKNNMAGVRVDWPRTGTKLKLIECAYLDSFSFNNLHRLPTLFAIPCVFFAAR